MQQTTNFVTTPPDAADQSAAPHATRPAASEASHRSFYSTAAGLRVGRDWTRQRPRAPLRPEEPCRHPPPLLAIRHCADVASS